MSLQIKGLALKFVPDEFSRFLWISLNLATNGNSTATT